MKDLACHLRSMQFYAHNAHNMCRGDEFFSDHEELGALYSVYESAYDSVVERIIGLGQEIDLITLQKEAADKLAGKPKTDSFSKSFECLLECELELCEIINKENEKASLGTQNLLQGIADLSEVRQYKFKQKTKNSKKQEAEKEAALAQQKKEPIEKEPSSIVKLLTSKD